MAQRQVFFQDRQRRVHRVPVFASGAFEFPYISTDVAN